MLLVKTFSLQRIVEMFEGAVDVGERPDEICYMAKLRSSIRSTFELKRRL